MSSITAPARPPASARRSERRSEGTALLLGPALLFLGAFSLWPFVYLLYASFTSYQLAIPIPITFTGLGNFTAVLGNPRFWRSLYVTAVFALVGVPLQLLLGLALALLLDGIKRGRDVYASLLLIPVMLAPIVVGFSWNLFLNPVYGPFNAALKAIGFASPPAWAQSPDFALATVVLVDIWQWTPLVMVILLAGLRSIPPRVYEAARVDGSSPWQTFAHVVLPMLAPYLTVAFVLRFIDSFKVFDIVYILTKGGPGTATQNLAYYTYDLGFGRFEFGRSGALSIVQLVLLVVGTTLILKLATSGQADAPPTAVSKTVKGRAA